MSIYSMNTTKLPSTALVNKSNKDTEKENLMQDRIKDKSVGYGSAFVGAYKMYISHFGVFNLILMLMLYVLNQGLMTGSSIWLTYWSDQSNNRTIISDNRTKTINNNFYIGIYASIGLGTVVCAFLRNLLLFTSGAKAS